MKAMKRAAQVLVFLFLVLILVPSTAQAKFYVGASFGESSADLGVGEIADGSVLSAITVDDSDSGQKLYAGVSFFKFVAIEAAMVDLGEFTISATSDGTGFDWVPGPVTAVAAVDGILVSAVGRIPVGKITLFAKAGYYVWEADLSFVNGGMTFPDDDDDADVAYGAGISFKIGIAFSIRAEYEIFDIAGSDVDFYSAGIAWRW